MYSKGGVILVTVLFPLSLIYKVLDLSIDSLIFLFSRGSLEALPSQCLPPRHLETTRRIDYWSDTGYGWGRVGLSSSLLYTHCSSFPHIRPNLSLIYFLITFFHMRIDDLSPPYLPPRHSRL